jgi:uncharacterized phage protein (TIGR01671 family)
MREIKFRAWDAENEEMLFQGDNAAESNGVMECQFIFDCMGHTAFVRTYGSEEWVERKNTTLKQFTGAYDSDRKEIFEGDIIECGHNDVPSTKGEKLIWRGVVEYSANHTHFYVRRTDVTSCNIYSVGFGGSAVKYWRVVGNIHQNPELLK